jgi:hypothetical protein
MREREMSRKQFLAAMGAGGAALLAPGTAAATTRPRLRPTDLSFATQAQYRPF